MEFRERSELQLLRASRGAHELTKMIDSWSKYLTADAQQQRCIADELLRGATELQESLLMLSRLQGASRRMPTKKMMQREREEDEEKDGFSTNCMQEMRQVVRNRMYKFYNQNVSSTKPLVISKSLEKMKAPNLIAKLMGLEDLPTKDQIKAERGKQKVLQVENKKLDDIFETMRSAGVLKSELSLTAGTSSSAINDGKMFSKKSNVPPIVIMRPQQFPYCEREDQNLISQKSNLLLEEDSADNGCMIPETLEPSSVMSIVEEVEEPPQKLKKEVFNTQKQLKRAVAIKEKKRTDDVKKNGVNGRKQGEKKVLKAIGTPTNMSSTAGIKPEKRQATTNSSAQTRNFNFSMKSAPESSIRSAKEDKISLEKKPIRKLSKIDDKKVKDGNLSGITENHANSASSSSSAADGLHIAAQKEPTKPLMKDGIKRDHKVICEVMPKSYRTGQSLERFEESMRKLYYKPPIKYAVDIKSHLKPLLFTNQPFFNHVCELFGTNIHKPAVSHTIFSVEHEIVNDRLLLDSAKEMVTRQTREGKLSTQQIMLNGMSSRSADRCFIELVDEICHGIKKLECYSEFEDDYGDDGYKDSLDCILKKDLHCSETMLNAIWDDGWDCWICIEEADEPFVDMVEGIIFGLLLELTKDLLSSENKNV